MKSREQSNYAFAIGIAETKEQRLLVRCFPMLYVCKKEEGISKSQIFLEMGIFVIASN